MCTWTFINVVRLTAFTTTPVLFLLAGAFKGYVVTEKLNSFNQSIKVYETTVFGVGILCQAKDFFRKKRDFTRKIPIEMVFA